MNILIVDDNMSVCVLIKKYISKYLKDSGIDDIRVNAGITDSAQKLISYIEDGGRADVIFMDIELGKYNGIELAAKLQSNDAGIEVVFITGHIEYAPEIFNARPFNFLIKPLTYEKVGAVLDKVIAKIKDDGRELIYVRTDSAISCIDINEIYYVEVCRKNVTIYLKDSEYTTTETFTELEQRLEPAGRLIKCHRSYLVNPDKIKRLTRYQIELLSGKIIPLSRSRSNEIFNKYLQFVP